MKLIIICLSFLLTGCIEFDAEIAPQDMGITRKCTDLRDGETFSFNTSDIYDLKVAVNGSASFQVKDSKGVDRFLTSDMESFLVCK